MGSTEVLDLGKETRQVKQSESYENTRYISERPKVERRSPGARESVGSLIKRTELTLGKRREIWGWMIAKFTTATELDA